MKRSFEEVAGLCLDAVTPEELFMIYERGGTPIIPARTAVMELAIRASRNERADKIGKLTMELFTLLLR